MRAKHEYNKRFIRGYIEPIPISLAIRKQDNWYCQKMSIMVHLCRMITCEHFNKCKRGEV